MAPITIGIGVAVLGGVPASAFVRFLPFLRDLNSAEVCGPNDQLIIHDYGDSYNIRCEQNWNRDLTVHDWGCALFFVAVVLTLAAIASLTRTLAARRPPPEERTLS